MAPEKEAGKNVQVKRGKDANLVANHCQEREGTNLLQGELLTADSSEGCNYDISARGLGGGEIEIAVNEENLRAEFCDDISLAECGDFLARRDWTDVFLGQLGPYQGWRKEGIG